MTREKFESAINSAMESATANPMRWGVDDCALWVANIEREVLGFDPAASYRGRYTTQLGAIRTMKRINGGDLLQQLRGVALARKWKRINPAFAQIGDVGMIWTEVRGKQVLATVICRKYGWFVGRNESGVSFMKSDRVAVAWSVLDDALEATGSRHAIVPQRGRFTPSAELVARDPISIAILGAIGIEAVAGSVVVSVTTFLITTAASPGVSVSVRAS